MLNKKILSFSLLVIFLLVFIIVGIIFFRSKRKDTKIKSIIPHQQSINAAQDNDIMIEKQSGTINITPSSDPFLDKVNSYLYILAEGADPSEKRKTRHLLATIKPADRTLDFLITHYNQMSTTDKELRLHIQSVITHIDPSGYIPIFKEEAQKTFDESLFVSLIFSLKKADTYESKKALIDLLEDNQLDDPTQGTNAIYRVLTDNITQDDIPWLYDLVENSNLSDIQIHVIARIAR